MKLLGSQNDDVREQVYIKTDHRFIPAWFLDVFALQLSQLSNSSLPISDEEFELFSFAFFL